MFKTLIFKILISGTFLSFFVLLGLFLGNTIGNAIISIAIILYCCYSTYVFQKIDKCL